MKRLKQYLSIFMILFIIHCSIVPSFCEQGYLTEEKLEKIDEMVKKKIDKYKIPGLSITIVEGNQTKYQKNFGYADISNKENLTGKSLFELGSTSKAFTGLAIHLLEKRGEVNLEDPITKYIPWLKMKYKGKDQEIKVKHFLYQTTGIPFKTIGKIHESSSKEALENNIKELANLELEFEPGEKFLYSTVNYDVLGLLIQNVSKIPYEEFMKEEIFKPLRMENTYLNRELAYKNPDMTVGYKYSYFAPRAYQAPEFRGNAPAGYVITCSDDMAKWMKYQLGEFQPSEELKGLQEKSHLPDRTVKPNSNGSSYASGWMVFQNGEGEFIHGGGNPNFTTYVILRPGEKLGITLLSNMSTDRIGKIGDDIKNTLIGAPIEPKEDKDLMPLIDKMSTVVLILSSILLVFTLFSLGKIVMQLIFRKRVFKREQKNFVGTSALTVCFIALIGYCFYKIPYILYDGLTWDFAKVWTTASLMPTVYVSFASIVAFIAYFQIALSTQTVEKDEIPIFPIVIFSFASGFGNAIIIFIINAALDRKDPIGSGLLLYLFLGILLYVLGQKIIRKKMVSLTNEFIYKKRMHLINKIIETPYYLFEKIENGKVTAVLNNDTEMISRMPNVIIGALTSIVTLVCACIYLGAINFWGLIISLAIIILSVTLYFLAGQSANKLLVRTREIQTTFFKYIRDLNEGFKELSLKKSKRDSFKEDMDLSCSEYRDKSIDASIKFADVFVIGELIFTIVICSVAFVFPVLFKGVSVETLRTYIFVFIYMTGPVHGILGNIPTLFTIRVSWDKINELIDEVTEIQLKNSYKQNDFHLIENSMKQDSVELTLSNLEFSYSEDLEKFKVGPITLTCKSGEITYLTGGNGSGKTTLFKLMTGLYKPSNGDIKINGNKMDVTELGEFCSNVFSDYYLFDKIYGIDYTKEESQINSYLKILGLADKVSIENGKISTLDLSSGQRKRLALLISYMDDRPIFFLDEVAADLDPEFKKIFYTELIPELKNRGKCIIAITHDDHYYHTADKLVKLHMGKIESIQVNETIANHIDQNNLVTEIG